MAHLKEIIKKHFGSFVFFYRYLRGKIFIAFVISILVSILDGFGLAMFLPLLQVAENKGTVDVEGMGNLHFLIDGIAGLGFELSISFVLLFMFVFFLLKGVAYYFSSIYIVILQQHFVKSMRLKLLYALNKISFKSFVVSDPGRIQNTMGGEIDGVSRAFASYFKAIEQGVMVGVYMAFAFSVDIQFATLVSIGGLITSFLYKIIYNYTKQASIKLTTSNNDYQGLLIQYVGHFKYLKATGKVNEYSNKLTSSIDDIESSRKNIGVLGSLGSSTREPILMAVIASVILIQVNYFGASMGTILISLLFFYRALTALIHTQLHWNSFMSVSGSMENMQEFQKEIESNQEEQGETILNKFEDSITLEHVNFSYGKYNILKDINLSINKNESIAFVGESGSGKTTLVNLIAGLFLDEKGGVYVDGIPMSKLDRNTYQDRIGYISQDPVIFNDSIFNNVTFWSEASAENLQRFENAVQQASLSRFIETLPDGLNTELGNNGINLSGGQKQRISIARELYKNIDILIMDEATSALDSETEMAIQQSIDGLQGDYTILIVAHRLSTIRNVDRIVYLNEGRIECEGNFYELARKHPRFRRMVELQEI